MEKPPQSPAAVDAGNLRPGIYEPPRAKIIEELIADGERKKALDVGCGSGYFCRILTNKGWSVTAIDTDRESVEKTRPFTNEAIVGEAISVLSNLPKDEFDLILALEIIEHMPKPQGEKLLEEVFSVLRPRGKLLLSTPNRYSPEGLGGYYWGEKIRGWKKWVAWDNTHVHIYNSREIINLVRKCGLIVERVTGYWYHGTLPLIGRWRLPFQRSGLFPLNRLGFNIILECRKR